MKLRLAVVIATLPAVAGCGGGGSSHTGGTTTATAAATPAIVCDSPAARRALARIRRDTAAIQKAAARITHDTLQGTPQVNAATDRFLHDVDTAPLDNLVRNRLIDHAAAALVGSCGQCFQALEADRPIPSIRGHTGPACHAS